MAVLTLLSQDAGSQSYLKAAEADMHWWRKARFGLFVHWGPVSLKGTEIGWTARVEESGAAGRVPAAFRIEVYDNLYREFNPVDFDAHEWVSIARDAGMKYIVFTTKHHDGFSMFDSGATDYKITSPASRSDEMSFGNSPRPATRRA